MKILQEIKVRITNFIKRLLLQMKLLQIQKLEKFVNEMFVHQGKFN